MATKIYSIDTMTLLDGVEIVLGPLKIKYLREFLDVFENIKSAQTDEESIEILVECARVCMKQYCPLIKTTEDVEDVVDINMLYKIIDVAAGIKVNEEKEESVSQQAQESNQWENFDLAKLEAEVFQIGIWKDYEELELSLSLPELTATLEAKRELDYQEKKFLAAIQGVDLEDSSDKSNAWEDMKARVFSGGQATDSKDILAFQGINAAKAGFGIGAGLGYEKWD